MNEIEIPSTDEADNKSGQTMAFAKLSTIPVDLTIEVGKAKLTVEELMSLKENDVVALNKLRTDPLDIKVNGQCVGEGEVVVSDDQFYIKVTKILDKA